MGLQAQALSLQGDRAAAAEWIEDRRRVTICGLQDLGPGLVQNLFVVGVLPQNKPLDNPEEPLPLCLLGFLCRKLF